MGFEISINAFEGPIELLLHLIKTKKMDITRIAIAAIIDDYLAYMDKIPINIDQSGEFIQVATLLLKYKVRCLLPVETISDELEDDIDDLLQVMQNKYYSVMADLLDTYQIERGDFFSGGKRPFLMEQEEKLEDAMQDVTLLKLALVYDFLQNKQTEHTDPKTHVPMTEIRVTLAEQKQWLLETYQDKRVYLSTVIQQSENKLKQVITFLAILECIQEGLVMVITHGLEDPLLLFSV